jgi:dienelactone hydrolase
MVKWLLKVFNLFLSTFHIHFIVYLRPKNQSFLLMRLAFVTSLFLFSFIICAQETITFPSKDGIDITADQYISNDTLPYMILCHQAGYSRGEYSQTALRFQKFGYNCLAIDARSGKEANGIINETAVLAQKNKKSTNYLDAEQDILAAIDYAFKKSNKKIILVGSSYSASLVLKIAATNDKVKAVLAFSPGEYFGDKLNLKETIKTLDKPVFATSSKEEAPSLSDLMKGIKSSNKTQFTPSSEGDHGSKALWKNPGSNYHEYWLALFMFMRNVS